MTKPKDYCPFTHVMRDANLKTARALTLAVLASDTYAELKAELRSLDKFDNYPKPLASYVAPDCDVFEISKGEWIPMRHLHKLASTFLEKHC